MQIDGRAKALVRRGNLKEVVQRSQALLGRHSVRSDVIDYGT